MTTAHDLVGKIAFTREEIIQLLSAQDENELERIRQAAERILLDTCGDEVYYRGLIEFSNICRCDCLYCGIRKSMKDVDRYELALDAIVESAQWCAEQGYGSVVLQSGERTDERFISFVQEAVAAIKQTTVSETLPHGLGITLCVGEQTRQSYERFFSAGAHRYLLRIESSNPALFSRIHPPQQTLDSRIRCLRDLAEIGFQVGTGVMIGLPGQTVEHLADDILFFRDMDIDMIGMGPYIPHAGTPLGNEPIPDEEVRTRQALLMIAATRLVLKNVNIAATTALQALHPQGREEGLRSGANVIMPQLTPVEVRKNYLLYENKPCVDESAVQCRGCLAGRIGSVGRTIGYNKWGDSRHFAGKSG